MKYRDERQFFSTLWSPLARFAGFEPFDEDVNQAYAHIFPGGVRAAFAMLIATLIAT